MDYVTKFGVYELQVIVLKNLSRDYDAGDNRWSPSPQNNTVKMGHQQIPRTRYLKGVKQHVFVCSVVHIFQNSGEHVLGWCLS